MVHTIAPFEIAERVLAFQTNPAISFGVPRHPHWLYLTMLHNAGHQLELTANWSSTAPCDLSEFGAVVWEHHRTWPGRPEVKYGTLVLEHQGCFALIDRKVNGEFRVRMAGRLADRELMQGFIERLRLNLPEPVAGEDRIEVRFWHYTEQGPVWVRRELFAPHFSEIASNYPGSARAKLSEFFTGFEPSHGGQLILWHGPTGTGKTTALRALCREWQSWCKTEYILDPHLLFSNADYLAEMVLGQDEDHPGWDQDEQEQEFSKSESAEWRLLILEDMGELLSADAALRTRGLTALLNLTDGFIGQGLKVLVMITTNEQLGKLHEAVSRPGRTAHVMQFPTMDKEEADLWRREHGLQATYRPATLADLYAELEERVPDRPRTNGVGFDLGRVTG